ncbi:MAG: hypothetical protein RLZZ488_1941 [Pseudomonadota bacterium]|jgi:outer membrane protein assembly factor BamD
MKRTLNRVIASTMSASLAITALAVVTVGCEVKPISELTAEDGVVRLRALHKDENWERLIQEVNEYKSRYPYSQYASEADLLQADAYFRTNRHPEAIANYDDFLRRNPSHPQADLALFRIANSYDKQSPEEVDREQATTQRAIEKYKELIQKFPRSTHTAESVQRIAALKRRVADHHMFIGQFYRKKELWHGALTRFLFVADNFAEIKELQSSALTMAAEAYNKLAEQLEKDPKSDELSYFRSSTPAQLKIKANQLLERSKALSGTAAG